MNLQGLDREQWLNDTCITVGDLLDLIEQSMKEKELLVGWIIDKTKKGKDFKREDAIRAIEQALKELLWTE